MAIQQRTGDAKVKGVADIVFVFDCTGSKKPYIDNVKENVSSWHQILLLSSHQEILDYYL